MGDELRYGVAACQVDQPNPTDRAEMARNTAGMVEMVDMAVEGYGPFMDIKLLAFPEFAHAAPIYPTAKSLLAKLAVPVPNEHTARLEDKARELGVYIQTATFIEEDPQWPGKVFNTTCLLGPEGLWYKYRKVNPWVPWEVHTSPHDLADYEDETVPGGPDAHRPALARRFATTGSFPNRCANSRPTALKSSSVSRPIWTLGVRRRRWIGGRRSIAAVPSKIRRMCSAANQGAELSHYPPFSWPGGSMVVDFDGRILAQAESGAGRKNRRLRSRYRCPATHPQAARWPPHLGPPAQRGVPHVRTALLSAGQFLHRRQFTPSP